MITGLVVSVVIGFLTWFLCKLSSHRKKFTKTKMESTKTVPSRVGNDLQKYYNRPNLDALVRENYLKSAPGPNPSRMYETPPTPMRHGDDSSSSVLTGAILGYALADAAGSFYTSSDSSLSLDSGGSGNIASSFDGGGGGDSGGAGAGGDW